MIELFIWILVYFTLWYVLSIILKNSGIVDIGWGLGFVGVTWFLYFQNGTLPGWVISIPVSLWGLRLAYHIFKRNFKKPEDFRYAKFRKDWGKIFYVRAYFQLFLFQGLMMFLISLPIFYAHEQPSILYPVVLILGSLIWLIGFSFEAIGDHQLKRFIKNPENKGKLIDMGLWKYTRHPNYFGEALLWWGIWVMSLSFGGRFWGIIGPITITVLVRYVSGVPMLEKRLQKYEGYQSYIDKTNLFIPWFPKKEKNQ